MRSVTSVQSRQTLGALQMCAGMLIIPFLDVFAKLLGATHEPFEITFWRFFMQSALMLPFVIMLRLFARATFRHLHHALPLHGKSHDIQGIDWLYGSE